MSCVESQKPTSGTLRTISCVLRYDQIVWDRLPVLLHKKNLKNSIFPLTLSEPWDDPFRYWTLSSCIRRRNIKNFRTVWFILYFGNTVVRNASERISDPFPGFEILRKDLKDSRMALLWNASTLLKVVWVLVMHFSGSWPLCIMLTVLITQRKFKLFQDFFITLPLSWREREPRASNRLRIMYWQMSNSPLFGFSHSKSLTSAFSYTTTVRTLWIYSSWLL